MNDSLPCNVPHAGCTFTGESEIIKGRKLFHFRDGYTGSDFCVPAEHATEAGVQKIQREHRERFTSAGPSFAPVP